MGIFDFFRKNRHKECRNNQHTTEVMDEEEEEADLWTQAYMAKPHCYTKEGKKPILSFVVTEGINTILPMYPNELYRKGKNSPTYASFLSARPRKESLSIFLSSTVSPHFPTMHWTSENRTY